ncbi:ABC transporter substrate-binding protein [Pseudonocardia thermophila]|uniref:ABC transporter substrate-binding protein n=1 Tax=Pseudonocardia thermophila TaxID=1848 RepID=UPI00248E93FF|nr:extracellular solute-binding protein [Pseudonocardia thermophila]
MRPNIIRTSLAAAAAAVLLMITGCGSSAPAAGPDGALVIDGETIGTAELYRAAQDEGTLTAYLSYPTDVSQAILDRFSQDTGINVELVRLNSSGLYNRIIAEAGANQLPADVISLSEAGLYNDLRERGIIAAHKVANFADLPADRRAGDGSWYSVINLVTTIAYNNKVVPADQAPRSWADLLDPRWVGKIGTNHIHAGGASYTTFTFLKDKYGLDYWRDLAAQKPLLTDGVGALTDQLSRGEIAVSINHLGTVKTAIENGQPLSIVYPSDGVPTSQERLGMSATAPHPNAAKLYLEWTQSVHGGNVIAEASGEYPTNPKAAPPREADGRPSPTFEQLGGVSIPTPDSATREEQIRLWDTTFSYTSPAKN